MKQNLYGTVHSHELQWHFAKRLGMENIVLMLLNAAHQSRSFGFGLALSQYLRNPIQDHFGKKLGMENTELRSPSAEY